MNVEISPLVSLLMVLSSILTVGSPVRLQQEISVLDIPDISSRKLDYPGHGLNTIRFSVPRSEPDVRIDRKFIPSRSCPCSNVSLCETIKHVSKKEVFVFSLSKTNWRRYDWSKMTTIVAYGYHDDDLLCYAHGQGVRVVTVGHYPTAQLTNKTARTEWVKSMVQNVTDNFLDGINIDYEDGMKESQHDLRLALTALVQELNDTLKAAHPHSQISFDFAYSPICCGRFYDYRPITHILDFMFIMAYDEACPGKIAWANSARNITLHGIQEYLILGINPEKMVLGVPWYGYLYQCANFSLKSGNCTRSPVHRQVVYSEIVQSLLPQSFSGRLWDPVAMSPYADIRNKTTGEVSQLWYDDVESLAVKYAMATFMDLRGVGMWQADAVNYSDPSQVDYMWGPLP